MKKYIIIFGVSLLLFGFVRDYNENVKKAQERQKEIKVVHMWINQKRGDYERVQLPVKPLARKA